MEEIPEEFRFAEVTEAEELEMEDAEEMVSEEMVSEEMMMIAALAPAIAVEKEEQLYIEDVSTSTTLETVEITFASGAVAFEGMEVEEEIFYTSLSAFEISMLPEYTEPIVLNASQKRSLGDFDVRSFGYESSKRGRFTCIEEQTRLHESAVFRRTHEVRRGSRMARQKCRELERRGEAVYLD